MTTQRSRLILAALSLAGTTFALLQSIVVPALPAIERGLHAGASAGGWMLSLNLLSTAVLTPALGRLGDMHGKDRVLLAALGALGAGTLACALAPSLAVMLAGRALQGAGGAVFPLAFGIVRDELPAARVAGAIGLVSSLLGIGAGLGLVVPGMIVSALGWRWLFWLPLGALVLTTALVARSVPASPIRTPAPLNLAAAALMTAGLASLLVALSESAAWGWGAPSTLGLFGAGALATAAWVALERRARAPLVDMRLMATRPVWSANLAAFLLGVGMYASIALVPALVELPRSGGGLAGSVTAAGLIMFPAATVQLLVGPLTGRIERAIGSRAQLLAGMACLLIAYASLTVMHHDVAQLVAATTLLGLGLGLGLGALANLVVGAVGREQTGVATAMNTVMRTLGGAFGAQVSAACLSAGAGFTAAFALCGGALALGVISALAVPGASRRGARAWSRRAAAAGAPGR